MDTQLRKQTMVSSSTSIHDLKDDDLIEILVRLPVDSVHQSKCVSKRWLDLISQPCFIRWYIQRQHATVGSNDCLQSIVYHQSSDIYNQRGNFGNILLHRPKRSTSPNLSLEFLPLPGNSILRRHTILASSHGLLLCKVEFKKKRNSIKPKRSDAYYVCNPLTKQWVQLPPCQHCPRGRKCSASVGFACHSGCSLDADQPHKIAFTIVKIVNDSCSDDAEYFLAHVFSSDTGCWTLYRVSYPPTSSAKWFNRLDVNVVCIGQIFHIKMRGPSIYAYDPWKDPCNCKCISLPNELLHHGHDSERLLGLGTSSGGYLAIITGKYNSHYNSKTVTYRLWELEDCTKGTWCRNKLPVKLPFNACCRPSFSFFLGDQTYGDILCIKIRSDTSSDLTLRLFDMGSGSLEFVFPVPKDPNIPSSCSVFPFHKTPWPTLIPQLPHEPI